MLADHQIIAALEGGRRGMSPFFGLDIDPFTPEHINPASVDLTLSPIVCTMRPTSEVIDVAKVLDGYGVRVDMSRNHGRAYTLSPGEFLLGATNEVITLPATLAARVEGKSSIGRLGVAVHITAGFIDPGFSGSITLEIANLSRRPVLLRPNMRICQIAFTPMDATPARTYDQTGHYQDQPAGEPVLSRYRMDPEPAEKVGA
jgi:dCTP deaminase